MLVFIKKEVISKSINHRSLESVGFAVALRISEM